MTPIVRGDPVVVIGSPFGLFSPGSQPVSWLGWVVGLGGWLGGGVAM